jgi:hypothetical protein
MGDLGPGNADGTPDTPRVCRGRLPRHGARQPGRTDGRSTTTSVTASCGWRRWAKRVRRPAGTSAWVMMNNHYHLLLETPEANPVAGMKWLQGTFLLSLNSPTRLALVVSATGPFRASLVPGCFCGACPALRPRQTFQSLTGYCSVRAGFRHS